jgi:hypothetical protein
VTTYRSVQQYGAEIEMHMAQRLVWEWFGTALGVPLTKLAQVAAAVPVAMWWRAWTPWLLTLCGLLYGVAALSNHFMWF